MQNRKKILRHRSGGIALIRKLSCTTYQSTKNRQPLIFWFAIDHTITLNNETVYCGIVYISLNKSKYSHNDLYLKTQRKIDRICVDSKIYC